MPGLVIYRFDAPLFFANAKSFRDEIMAVARAEPAPRWIVIAAEPITDVDTTAADVLFDLDKWLDERGQALVFAELKDPVRRKIERYGLAHEIEPQHFFPTLEAAVDGFRARTGAEWGDGAVAALPEPPAVPLPQVRPPSEHRSSRHPT
jgi:MFS superfamily sulfate permease-like transporter